MERLPSNFIKKGKYDIAILDVSMPHMSGLNVASTIRQTDNKLEIIMLSAFADTEKLFKSNKLTPIFISC